MKRVTMQDVATEANVSKSTVSQYINKRYDYMGEETKNRIEQAIKVLGYQPNYVARSLKQKKTSTIGVIVANILHTFSTQVIRAIEDYCHEHDFHVIVCNADDDPEKERKYIEMLRAKQVDGLIVFPTGENLDLYNQMLDEKFPLVFADRFIDHLPVKCILLDNEKASMLAVNHLIENGYKDIGIVTTSLERKLTPRIERVSGYKEALNNNGVDVNETYVQSVEVHRMKEVIKEMLSLPEPPKALIAGNDLALMEVLKVVKEEQISIPQDLAIIGIDEVSFASLFNPTITTVAQPAFEMGKDAAHLLLELIKHPAQVPERNIYRYEPILHIRNSS
ncbi:substrate-binding domain-containing protein [Bacillus shivajii]|uniref:LacI family DNA-binding transcriptional regulator n=1 Tax=Bacillus shivajii TaxID=1983719 RepID=UPI001CF9D749|nr:substrate-binding domain-containing protein [Bacillus shivajii]UCZ53858.1 substrate-binding domain-containing protein [Bacillus shivajii]